MHSSVQKGGGGGKRHSQAYDAAGSGGVQELLSPVRSSLQDEPSYVQKGGV
jgi:hypothetical protein